MNTQDHSICNLEKLANARDIACARACCLGVKSIPSNERNKIFRQVSGGLPKILVSFLSDAFQQWQKFYRVTTVDRFESSLEPESIAKSTERAFCKSDEVRALQRVLNLLAKVSLLDTTLSEEIGRDGSQAILCKLLEQIKVCVPLVETNGSEEDFDALMDLQDTACEVYIPSIIRGGMAFTGEELIARLPLVYNLHPTSSTHAENDTTTTTTILIHQVTKRQTAQADVGYLMWPSAIVLSRWLLSNTHILKDKTILEIGAGCGLVGILAATIVKDCNKPDQVIITDVNNVVLENISRNISLNDVTSVASVTKLDFYRQTGENHAGRWIGGGFGNKCEEYFEPVDVVLAADIICQPEDAVAAARTIYDSLVPGGVAYVVCANEKHRFGVGKFAGECEALKLRVISTNVIDMCNGDLLTDCMETAAGWENGMTLTFFEVSKER